MPANRTEARARGGLLLLAVALGLGAGGARAAGDEPGVIREGFESERTAWSQEQTDATIELLAHDRSNRAAHEGRLSEHFRFTAGVGSGFYFSYPLPKVPVSASLKTSVYVRANRAGVQVFARVLLPADTDPETNQPSFLLVPGTIYDNVDRWQRLEVLDLPTSLERQARVLRASTKRPVSLEGAYVERLVVNLFTGSGTTEVFLDELSVGPVPAALAAAHAAAAEPGEPGADGPGVAGVPEAPPEGAGRAGEAGPARTAGPVRLDRNRLKRRAEDGLYHDWVFTAIDADGADVAALRNAGFDVLVGGVEADRDRWQEAVKRGFLLMPRVGPRGDAAIDPDRVFRAAGAFPFRDSVFAWHLGDRLGLVADLDRRKEHLTADRAAIDRIRDLPRGTSTLTTGVVDDLLPLYARMPQNLDMLGIRPSAWGSSVSLINTNHFLRQRRDLAVRGNAGALFWAELPATAPAAVPRAIWGTDVPPAWGTPLIQPEQLRLMTYAALASGYRGFAFKGDAELTRGASRMLLLEMAMLNAEIDLCESIFANGADPIAVYNAYPNDPSNLPPPGAGRRAKVKKEKERGPFGEIRAAAIGTTDRKGVLLVVGNYAADGQFQPHQMARNEINLTVIVPEGAQAYEISPGEFKVVEERVRTVGGTRFRLPEFDTTALLLITTDDAMARRVEAVINGIAPAAAKMAIEQAELKLQWVTDINGRLAALGHYLVSEDEKRKRRENGGPVSTDQADLLRKAAESIQEARANAERLDWAHAWAEARRASRPLRILMRGLWENARKDMERANTPAEELAMEEQIKLGKYKPQGPPRIVPPVASAPLVAFNTLPQHYVWVDAMRNATFGRNLVPGGSFEDPDTLKNDGWVDEGYPYEGIKSVVQINPVEPEKPKEGDPPAPPLPEGALGNQLRMIVMPVPGRSADTLTPYIDHPAAAIRTPAVKVRAGQFLRVSVVVQRKWPSPQGAGGLVIRDSIGGEALQYVANEAIPVRSRVILYRRAPADGDFTVTLGLAGYGDAYFDDLRIERVEAPAAGAPPADVARSRAPRTRAR